MIVTLDNFDKVVEELKAEPELGLDTETTGLRMYHGDKIFSLILASPREAYYFNFHPYKDLPEQFLLDSEMWEILNRELFQNQGTTWFIQNAANFDLCMLKAHRKIELAGRVHCTKAIGRVERNDHQDFSLASQLERIGLAKDTTVEKYIAEHRLFTVFKRPGRVQKEKYMHFDQVPFEIISPYGEMDGVGVLKLGQAQVKSILEQDADQPDLSSGRSLKNVMENEIRLQKTIFKMKDVGVRIDRAYCEKAAIYEDDRAERASENFRKETGVRYSQSPKLFAEVFKSEKSSWKRTEKGNPSFDAEALSRLKHPAAKEILQMRDAKSKADFYRGFLYHADSNGDVHPNYNPEGTVHGRFSSSEPNFQNLTAEDDEETLQGEFVIRRAIIPRPGFIFIMPDYDQMEYKFALEMGCRVVEEMTDMAQLINGGFDFHDATAKRVLEVSNLTIPRKTAKISNFLTLYGGGNGKLAQALGIPLNDARKIREAIFRGMPEIKKYIEAIMTVAEERKYIINWLGRRSHFAFKRESYRAPNYHVSGGCADVVKVAMNRIDNVLLNFKSHMVMTVHDELPIEVHESEITQVPAMVKIIMEQAFTSEYVPLTVGMEWSAKSLADKIKGAP